ncbi:MAG: restriction endonuclease subunit S [Oscillibacter sp.]|nr:restriction endonuclease subunit S [Oscillibacter sp.]
MSGKKTRPGFVPEAEQPYKIPDNWRWVRLGGITTIVGGGTPSTKNKAYYENGDIPWISPADLSNYSERYISHGAKNISRLGLEKSSAQLLPADTVCLSTRAPIGYVVIARNPLSTNQGFKSFLPSPTYLPEYLYWYLKGNKDLLESRASGTTFLELSGRKAANIEFPLPPLAEQARIVERIESLLTKLDKARRNIVAVSGHNDAKNTVLGKIDIMERAILGRAFRGELGTNRPEESPCDIVRAEMEGDNI